MKTHNLCKAALERFPFGVVFAKEAPEDAKRPVDYDNDFCYHYFSPGLNRRSQLMRVHMCTGKINAKHDFDDYQQYFHDDIDVMKTCYGGRVLARVEPWRPPGADMSVYTRKTAMVSAGRPYLLSVFERVDDVALGLAKQASVDHDASAALPPLSRPIEDAWFVDAVEAFPCGLSAMSVDGSLQPVANKAWLAHKTMFLKNEAIPGHHLHASLAKLFETCGWTHEQLMHRAVWMTGLLRDPDNRAVDIGAYDILVDGSAWRVVYLRPAMEQAAMPRYQALWVAS